MLVAVAVARIVLVAVVLVVAAAVAWEGLVAAWDRTI